MADHRLPTHLKHKPLIAVDYQQKDYDNTGVGDSEYLSLGLAQWDKEGKDVAAKIFRRTSNDGRWSRQSEELPFCRVLDLAIFIIDTFKGSGMAGAYFGNELINNDNQKIIEEYFNKNRRFYENQINELKKIIDK